MSDIIRISNIVVFILCIASNIHGQIITINPKNATGDDQVTLTFDASQGNNELMGSDQVYVHLGVITDKPDGNTWKYVMGNWGKDDGIGKMTKTGDNKWSITFSPTLRQYFKVPTSETIFRLACVFRNADGSKKGTVAPGKYDWGNSAANNDIFINLTVNNYLTLDKPIGNEAYLKAGTSLTIQATASSTASEMKIWIDEGQGYTEKQKITYSPIIQYEYFPTNTHQITIKITAIINNQTLIVEKHFDIVIRKDTEVASLPPNLISGVNYDANNPNSATLVLTAPNKDFIYVVGDFTDWQVKDEYQMKRTPDGKTFWLEINGINPNQDYVYQYWIDGKIKVADPYTHQVADPWNDKDIESSVFPDLPSYNRKDLGIAAVLKTGQTPYQWSAVEGSWQRPDVNHLAIYELHLRDFIASHNYNDLADTLTYLKRLGVQAIELMPINEFEGNDSWGYNPSFFFAPDKYYGTAHDLKRFIELAHQQGIAVILDIVLNHAFGQNPMVQMYFEDGKPAANNPWFNREYVGPYQWGYDFNHESPYTQQFVDDVNRYWLEEFHIDGFRFDFTKGFTNYAPGGNIDGFDQSRINILKRMSDKIRQVDPKAYIILEHWGVPTEEAQLASYGMKMWRNKSYDFVPAAIGNTNGTFADTDATTHVSFFDSHDERRIAEHCLTEGKSSGFYNIKDTLVMFERVKMAAAFSLLQPGPKMIWQFDELGYDISIDYNGRTGRKPLVWGANSLGYYKSDLRQNIYKTYQALLQLRNTITPQTLASSRKNHKNTGETRRLSFDTPDTDLVVIGNVSMNIRPVNPQFTQTGWWYDYFTGDSINVSNPTADIALKPGEWHVYTSKKMSKGFANIVETYENPVSITPYPFKATETINIRLNTHKAWPGNTAGLKNANTIYMHAGVILASANTRDLTHIVGTYQDDGIGLMSRVIDSIWEINIVPNTYFAIQADETIEQIGMWFRNESNTLQGYGFRNRPLYFDVLSDEPIIRVSPSSFDYNSDVTITFNAAAGNRELAGADKVYIHSGVVLKNTSTPKGADWSKVKGNWGKDDGIGLMTKIAGKKDLWQITLKLDEYFNLIKGDHPYWIAAVFRNANGSVKGTAQAGSYDFGLIDGTSLDFFIKNDKSSHTDNTNDTKITVFPNPAAGFLQIQGIQESFKIDLFDTSGKLILQREAAPEKPLDITMLTPGIYLYTIYHGDKISSGKVTVF